jgi:hypothetical protein
LHHEGDRHLPHDHDEADGGQGQQATGRRDQDVDSQAPARARSQADSSLKVTQHRRHDGPKGWRENARYRDARDVTPA